MIKKRNWAFVCYPESMPENWLDILTETGLPIAISPLHDLDLNPDKTYKKSHYHVICCYSGPTSFNVVSNLTSKLNATIPIPLEQIKGYYRYLVHKDNPEKHQYSENDIKFLNGFSPFDYIDVTCSDVLKIKKELINFIIDNKITEYFDFVNMVAECYPLEYFDIATNHTYFFEKYISSYRNKNYNML